MTRHDLLRSARFRAFVAATVVAFGLRLPFAMASGFGLDFDAWLLASSARAIAEEGVWRSSRAPGYPLVELLFAALWPLGTRALTVATALAAAAAAGFGAAALTAPGSASTGVPRRVAAVFVPVALTALPCVAIPAASALDMPWALAALSAAVLALTVRRPTLAGFLIGIAVLARPASAVVIPALYWHVAREHGHRAAFVSVAVSVAAGATLALVPDGPPLALGTEWPGLDRFATLTTSGALGPGGLAAVALAFLGWALMRRTLEPTVRAAGGGEPDALFPSRFAFGAAAAGLLLFAVFPYEANYLGATVFLAGVGVVSFVPPRVLLLSASLAVLGGLVVPTSEGLRAGPLRRDMWRREAQVTFILEQARVLRPLPASAEVSAGPHAATLRFFLRGAGPAVAVEVTESRRRDLAAKGRQVVDL